MARQFDTPRSILKSNFPANGVALHFKPYGVKTVMFVSEVNNQLDEGNAVF